MARSYRQTFDTIDAENSPSRLDAGCFGVITGQCSMLTRVPLRRLSFLILIALGCLGSSAGQESPVPKLSPGSARKSTHPSVPTAAVSSPQVVKLSVPMGTPLQVVLDEEIRLSKEGHPVHARITEPVYVFDRPVIPVGSKVEGRISKIGKISGGARTLAALNADFTPARKVEVEFSNLDLPDGSHFRLETSPTTEAGQIIRLTAAESQEQKRSRQVMSKKTRQVKEEAKREWTNAVAQLKMPGRKHRLERYIEGQLPVRRQYIPVGTVYLAEIDSALDFGTETISPQMISSGVAPLPVGSVVRGRLTTALTSGTSLKGDVVEALVTQPLLDSERRVILAQGSRLRGRVIQVRRARRMKKNGLLRIAFEELIQPDGISEKVEATLEGIESAKGANVRLDSEGGTGARTPKTRYLATALSLTLAAASVNNEGDVGNGVARGGSSTGSRVAGGAAGFKLAGIALGLAVHSRGLGYTMGGSGAAMSVYSHFIARGRDVAFPKNTIVEIGIGRQQ
jgi:hypothetical protein